MKLIRTLSIALVLATTVFATRSFADDKKPAPAPAASEVDAAGVAKFLAFWDKFVDTVVADAKSCPKMATDINALIDANKDLLAMAAEAQKAGKKLPKSAQDHMMGSIKKLMPAMQACQNDKAVQAAMMRMSMGQAKAPAKAPPATAK